MSHEIIDDLSLTLDNLPESEDESLPEENDTGTADYLAQNNKIYFLQNEKVWVIYNPVTKIWEKSKKEPQQLLKPIRDIYNNKKSLLQIKIATEEDQDEQKSLRKELMAVGSWYKYLTTARNYAGIFKALSQHDEISLENDDKFILNKNILPLKNGKVLDIEYPGFIRDATESDMLTFTTNFEYNPDNKCPLWLNQLNWTFAKSSQSDVDSEETKEFIRQIFIQILFGFEKSSFIIFWGETGRNGKGTLKDVINELLTKNLATVCPSAYLTGRNSDDKMSGKFSGKRFVSSDELEKTDKINSGIIKEFTGGGWINVRKNYKDGKDEQVSALFMLLANLKPVIDGNDSALRKRTSIIPFDNQFPEGEEDPTLKSKLVKENSGILNWLIEGMPLFIKNNYKIIPPPSIKAYTNNYFAENNKVFEFITDCFTVGTNAHIINPAEMWKIYQKYFTEVKKYESRYLGKDDSFWQNLDSLLQTGKFPGMWRSEKYKDGKKPYIGFKPKPLYQNCVAVENRVSKSTQVALIEECGE